MNVRIFLTVAAFVAVLTSRGTLADTPVEQPDAPLPADVRQIEYLADEGYACVEKGCSCAEEACACESGCKSTGCGCRRCCCGTIVGDPWELPVPCGLQALGVEWGGWLSAGVYGNAHGAAFNGPLGFNDVGDGFTVNQLWFYAEKVADTESQTVDWGFRTDFVFGVDGPDTQAFGGHPDSWDNPWDSARDYGSALPQFYGEIAINDLSVKFGHFYTTIGWEVVTAPDNFFYSHAYTMYYAEPFTHTGILASYQLSDRVTAHGGWTQGWDTGFDDTFEGDTFLGGLSLALTDSATVTWACSAGDFGIGAGDIYMNSIVLELGLTDSLTYILQHDLGNNTGLGAGNNEWYGINQYLQYQLNDRWAVGGRFEWFRDDDGARISFNGPAVGNYYALTAGLNWRPHANVMVRPEIRYDWFDGVAAAGDLPFDNGLASDQLSGGFDFIFTF